VAATEGRGFSASFFILHGGRLSLLMEKLRAADLGRNRAAHRIAGRLRKVRRLVYRVTVQGEPPIETTV